MSTDSANLIDYERTACLCSAGQPNYWAAVCVTASGDEHLVLAKHSAIGNPAVLYDPTCNRIAHDQLRPLPIEFVRRLTISRRTHRCGRPTQTGRSCRIRVQADGDACDWHRTKAPQ